MQKKTRTKTGTNIRKIKASLLKAIRKEVARAIG
jgi:hypothetical protein